MIAAGASPLLDHVWGISPGADRIWAQIAGIAPSTKPWERRIVVLQAYIDDSRTDNTFVVAGYVSTTERWAHFAQEWEKLLPFARANRLTGVRRFKMKEMLHHIEHVPAFYKIIEENVLFGLSCKIDVGELSRAVDRIWIENVYVNWAHMGQPYWFAFSGLLGMFHSERISANHRSSLATLMPLDQKVDFWFDDQPGKKAKNDIRDAWESFFKREKPDGRALYGEPPEFRSDEIVLPLQAADFWAWWTRKGYADGRLMAYRNGEFGHWRGSKIFPTFTITFSEDEIVDSFKKMLMKQIPISCIILDDKYHPKSDSYKLMCEHARKRGRKAFTVLSER